MLKIAGVVVSSIAGLLLSIPLLVGGDSPTGVACGEIGAILLTIRTIESGGDYTTRSAGSTASGAYQYIDSTWRTWLTKAEIVGDYPHAYLAPPEIQDQVAAANVADILNRHPVDAIPVIWYYPAALDHPELMDIVPAPNAGNRLTVRQYQQKWMTVHAGNAAIAVDPTVCAGTVDPSGYALPLPTAVFDADPRATAYPHHDYAAIDILAPVGTPIYALRSGSIARVTTSAVNCWDVGGTCREPCGTGVSINGDDGRRWIYCHMSALAPTSTVDHPVAAGQLLGYVGNTGRSGAPHLHLELKINGTRHCPQPLLQALHQRSPIPVALPTTGCSF